MLIFTTKKLDSSRPLLGQSSKSFKDLINNKLDTYHQNIKIQTAEEVYKHWCNSNNSKISNNSNSS